MKIHIRFCNSDASSDVIIGYDYLNVQVELMSVKIVEASQNMVFRDGICGIKYRVYHFSNFFPSPN